MSTTTQTTQTSAGLIGLRDQVSAVVNSDLAGVAIFSALGLLAAFYFMTHFPLSVEDATLGLARLIVQAARPIG